MFIHIKFKFSNLHYTDPLYLLKPSMFIQGVRCLAVVGCVFDQEFPLSSGLRQQPLHERRIIC